MGFQYVVANFTSFSCLPKNLPMVISFQRSLFLSSVQLTKCPPRRKRSVELRWRRKTNLAHFFRMTRSWHNIIPCDSCGNFHRKWMLCPTCYDQTRYETEAVRTMLRDNDQELSEETVLKYKNEVNDTNIKNKSQRILSVEHRERPTGWFDEKFWNH